MWRIGAGVAVQRGFSVDKPHTGSIDHGTPDFVRRRRHRAGTAPDPQAIISVQGGTIGAVGEVHPRASKAYLAGASTQVLNRRVA